MTELSQTHFDLDTEIKLGIELLRVGMQTCPSFDPTPAKYNEKNCYFNPANGSGLWLLRNGFHWAAELYYQVMLEEISTFEQNSTKKFNKGMVFANLGVAEIRGGKIDSGIAHLLLAEREDKPVDPDFKIFETILWEQFESTVHDYLLTLSAISKTVFDIDENFLHAFFRGIKPIEDRIFLSGTLLSIQYNRWVIRDGANSYSLGRFYSGLKDICLLTEALLRKRQYPRGTSGKNILLPVLLQNAVGNQLFDKQFVQNNSIASAPDLATFLQKLERFAQETPVERSWLYYLALVRNFTGHHFDLSDTEISPGGKTFFPELYEIALQNVLLALLYLKHVNAY